VRETVEEITIHKTVEVPTLARPKPRLFQHLADDDLLSYGIPPEWLDDVQAATEDTLFDVAEHLPQEGPKVAKLRFGPI